MHLNEYLKTHGITQAEFGQQITPTVSQSCIGSWIHGRRKIDLPRAIQIEKITDGAVTPQDCADMYLSKKFSITQRTTLPLPQHPLPNREAA
jgi:DNA-binding transcriptional regulator YdaS (Cro superfamily)